jgi:subtilisin family serine protease/subtilisin-like proprotein convertase family protein
MKKTSILVLLLFIFSSVQTAAQEYFFYHFKDKMVLNRDFGYLTVKFKPNTLQSEIDRVYADVASYSNKRTDFNLTENNFKKTSVLIIQLKQSIGADNLSLIEADIERNQSVDYIGMCFKHNDKVMHFSTDEVIVKFKQNVSSSDIRNLNALYKTNIIEQVNSFDNTYLVSVNHNGTDNVFDVANKYSLTQFVEFAQPNFIRSGMLLSEGFHEVPLLVTNDTLLPKMWHAKNTGTNIPQNVPGTPGCDMNVEPAWDITTGNPNIMIAIIDTGIDTNHTDLRANLCDRSLWYDAYDNDQKPYDEHYHGTGVSGTSSAVGNNIEGTVGIAFNCKIMPVRVFSSQGFTTDLVLGKGLNWAWQHGASVMNCSWGGGIPTPLISNAIQNAFKYGRNGRGAAIFAGAGNANIPQILYPSSMGEVISVGGLSPCNERKNPHSCDFIFTNDSNQYWGASYGEGLSVVAPCTFIGTTTLLGGWCICGNGTSVSSPLAAGVGALIISKNNNISADSVKIIIEKTAVKVGNYSYNIQKENGLWNNEMGYGRIDAKACLDATPTGPNALYEQVPPVINIFPPESRIYNSSIQVQAEIFDLSGMATGNNSPRLYYRTLQTNQLQIVSGVKVSDMHYQFTFPTIPQSEGFYYYIAAQDNLPVPNFATYPIGGAGVNPPGNISPPKFMFVRNTDTYDTSLISLNVPIPISQTSETTFVSVLNNPINKTVLDINCKVDVQHAYDADLTLSLISPAGTEIVLVGGTGGDSDNFTNTVFDDEATVAIDSSLAAPPYTGVFKPIEKLWLFDGENSFGEWKLRVTDNGYSDGGALLNWSVKFKYSTGSDYVTIPGNFSLVKNYPNPFNPITRIVFNVPKQAMIKIIIYDVSGREVKTVLNEVRSPRLEDFVDFDASSFASGVYFYSMIADDKFIDAKRMIFVK